MDFFIPPRFETEFNIIIYNISTRQCRQRISLYLIRLWPSSFFVKYPDSTHFSLQKRMKCVCLGVITICGLKPSSTILIRICLKTGNIVLYLLPLICHSKAQQSSCSVQGGYAGNAAGMKISSLHKLTDIR